ncbi:MAG TPA: hypothetical protein VK498_09500 [Ferruginibacter sp.]|nr:hypothetical protein [Ferruginibacter sp.]
MKSASVKEIKSGLENCPPNELLDLCLRLAKFKKENKELLTYLLFEEGNENGYIINIKDAIDLLFSEINTSNLYYVKKSLRKIVRVANRYIRYSNVETTQVEVLLYVCEAIRDLKINMNKSAALLNIYNGLVKKIGNAINGLHEDLQYDYLKELRKLE